MIADTFHKIVKKLSAEELFIQAAEHKSIFRKFVPLPSDYSRTDSVKAKRGKIRFQLNRSDYMQWRVYAGFKEPIYNFLENYLEGTGVIIDVGSNIGAFSLNVARLINNKKLTNLRIISFEPNPIISAGFRYNIKLNPILSDKIELHELACGSENQEANLTFNKSNSGGGRISTNGIPVKMVRLDDFLTKYKGQVKVLKIDVEGFEPSVLQGARKMISTSRPLLYMEVTDQWYRENGSSSSEVIQNLRSLHYDIYCERGDTFKTLDQIPTDFQFDLLAVPHR